MTIPGAIRTLKEAKSYAQHYANVTGEPWHVFKVAEGTEAFGCGYRFASFRDKELGEYITGGAEILHSCTPTTTEN